MERSLPRLIECQDFDSRFSGWALGPLGWNAGRVKPNPYSTDVSVAHFSQRTREMGHPVGFLRHRNNWSYTFRREVGHPPWFF